MFKELFQKINPHKKKLFFVGAALLILDAYLWIGIITAGNSGLQMFFLPVGQGDSELILLPGGVKILVDGGPTNGRALEKLGVILGPTDRRIDLVVLSHAQTDHYGGLIDVAKNYDIGAFLWNGDSGDSSGFRELQGILSDKKVPLITLSRGDTFCFADHCGEIVWPKKKYIGSEMNDRSLVFILKSSGVTALFTGDLGAVAEKGFLKTNPGSVDILKVAHHGSRFATSLELLSVLRPRVAIIEVGENNYGHPTEETMKRILDAGARLFRVDRDGLVTITTNDGKLRIFSEIN